MVLWSGRNHRRAGGPNGNVRAPLADWAATENKPGYFTGAGLVCSNNHAYEFRSSCSLGMCVISQVRCKRLLTLVHRCTKIVKLWRTDWVCRASESRGIAYPRSVCMPQILEGIKGFVRNTAILEVSVWCPNGALPIWNGKTICIADKKAGSKP